MIGEKAQPVRALDFPSLEKNRSRVLAILGLPVLTALFFLVSFQESLSLSREMIAGHLLVVLLWAHGTLVFYWMVARVTHLVFPAHADRISAAVPALSYYLVFVIYISSAIGVTNWGEPMTWKILSCAIRDLFPMARTLSIPGYLAVSAVIAPPLVLVSGFQLLRIRWNINSGHTGIDQTADRGVRRFRQTVISAFVCVVACAVALPEQFGIGGKDPFVSFFFEKQSYLPLTPARQRAVSEDMLARATGAIRQQPARKNVVLIIVDALRADHLSVYGYDMITDPFLRAWAEMGPLIRFDSALANSNDSRGGILAILNSRNYSTLTPFSYSLSDYLVDQGFSSTMILSGNHDWYGLKQSYGRTIHRFIHGAAAPGPNGSCDDEMLIREAEQLPPADQGRHFFFFHLMSVHEVGYLQPRFRNATPERPLSTQARAKGNPTPAKNTISAEYNQRVMQADDIIRQIIEVLERKNYLTDALVIVTADHGQNLGEHGVFGHGRGMSKAVLHIPLLVYSPTPLIHARPPRFATQPDIAPPIADLLGLSIPVAWQGQSLIRGETSPWSFHESTLPSKHADDAVIWRTGSDVYKYSYQRTSLGSTSGGQIYELVTDPDERHELISRNAIDPRTLGTIRQKAFAFSSPNTE